MQETVAGHPSAGLGWHGSCMVLPWPCPPGSSRAERVDPGLWSAFGGRGAGLLDAAGLSLRIYQSINLSIYQPINQYQYQSIKSIKSIKSIIGLVYRNILTRQPLVVNVKNHDFRWRFSLKPIQCAACAAYGSVAFACHVAVRLKHRPKKRPKFLMVWSIIFPIF